MILQGQRTSHPTMLQRRSLIVIQTIYICFQNAVDYSNYQWDSCSTLSDNNLSKNIAKMAKRLSSQMKPHKFILGFLITFKMACDASGVYEGAVMWLFHFSMKNSTSSALKSKLAPNSQQNPNQTLRRRKIKKLTTYQQVNNHLLWKYATDEVITDIEEEITSFTQPENKTPYQYAEELDAKTLCCGSVYDSQTMRKIFIKSIDQSIYHSIREYWTPRKVANLQDLASNATLLLKLQGEHQPTTRTSDNLARQGGRQEK